MNQIEKSADLVAYCGLYCGACGRYRKDKCPGCKENRKATWCKLRTCCIDHQFGSCADCTEFVDPHDCAKFNNIISKIFAVIFRSNRRACILQIRENGLAGHAEIMAGLKRQSLR